jgi:2-methylcitrate dehydratase PrpD
VVNDPKVIALRNKVQATIDDGIDEAAVQVTAVLQDGRRVEVRVDHAIGSLENPLSDAQLEAKFDSLVVPVLGANRAQQITRACRSLAALDDLRSLTALCGA